MKYGRQTFRFGSDEELQNRLIEMRIKEEGEAMKARGIVEGRAEGRTGWKAEGKAEGQAAGYPEKRQKGNIQLNSRLPLSQF